MFFFSVLLFCIVYSPHYEANFKISDVILASSLVWNKRSIKIDDVMVQPHDQRAREYSSHYHTLSYNLICYVASIIST
jgi:hypothetical protein